MGVDGLYMQVQAKNVVTLGSCPRRKNGAEGDGGVSSQLRADRFKLQNSSAICARSALTRRARGAILKLLQIIYYIVRVHI